MRSSLFSAKASGYTLPEIMITVVIIGLLTAVSAPLLVNMVNFWRLTTARNEIERDVRVSLDTMNRFLRQAQSGTVYVSRYNSSQPPYSQIQFTSGTGQNIAVYQLANKLMLAVNGSTSVLSRNLAYIAFTYPRTDDISIISVAVTMQYPTYLGGRKALQLSIQKVRIMN